MVKVVVAGRYPEDPDHIAGGPFYIIYLEVKTLLERDDVELHVVSRSKSITGYKHYVENGVHFHLLGEPRHRLVPRQLSMIHKIARVMKEIAPDIVVSHDPTETLAAVGAGLPTAYIVHGILTDELAHFSGLERLRFHLGIRLDKKAISSATRVMGISGYAARRCERFAPGRISMLRCPPVEDMFFAGPMYSTGKGILFAGTMNYLKNPLTLVHSMPIVLEKHPDAVLRLCGRPADAEYMESIRHYVRSNNLGENVQMLGVLSRQEILELLEDSVCLALPSRQENAPVVVAQAMAAARAVVATPVGGVPEMVEEGSTGFLVDPEDGGGMADRLISLLDDAALARRMGENARNKAMLSYERHAHVDSLLDVCNSILSGR
jgi:glycosyltransferase involved in cell wall biosynthesis